MCDLWNRIVRIFLRLLIVLDLLELSCLMLIVISTAFVHLFHRVLNSDQVLLPVKQAFIHSKCDTALKYFHAFINIYINVITK